MSTPLDGVQGQLHVLAARAGRLADEVRHRAGEVRAHARTQWSGAAADAYELAARSEAQRLDRCAAELDDLGAALRGHARGADRRLDQIAALFAAAQQALDATADLLVPGRGDGS